jgi:hypothetical protein
MMTLYTKSYDEKLHIAKTTTDSCVLSKLSNDAATNVRRAVARNTSTPSDVLYFLVNDPVANVSYMANQNPNCKDRRNFKDDLNPCITCQKDEREIYCVNCENLNKYYQEKQA